MKGGPESLDQSQKVFFLLLLLKVESQIKRQSHNWGHVWSQAGMYYPFWPYLTNYGILSCHDVSADTMPCRIAAATPRDIQITRHSAPCSTTYELNYLLINYING